jgi:transposase-like protein
MNIARNPNRNAGRATPAASKKQAKKFIRGKSGPAAARELVGVLINFDRELLDRITQAAREMGLNRSAFIVSAAAEKLRPLERA